jgi:hypothetical protein
MKKILSAITGLLLVSSLCFAQDAKNGAQPSKTDKKGRKEAPAAKANGTMPEGKMKKDGTPDMRYKENKTMKKDTKPAKTNAKPMTK